MLNRPMITTYFGNFTDPSTNDMKNQTKTIRLIYPQWQGADIAQWITEVKDPEQASRGYYLGALLLHPTTDRKHSPYLWPPAWWNGK